MSKFLRDSFFYTFTTFFLQFALFFVTIITKQLLGPEQLGIWALIQIILTYLSLVDLGVVDAGWKEMAFTFAKGDNTKGQAYLSGMFGYNILTSILTSLLILIYNFIFYKFSDTMFWGLLYLAFAFPFVRLNNCFISYYRSISAFSLLSRFNILSMIFSALLGLSFVFFFNIYGIFLSAFLTVLLLFFLWVTHYRKKSALYYSFSFKLFKPLLRIGIPMALGGFLFTILRSLDSLFVNYWWGPKDLGFYNMGFSLAGYIFLIPNSLSVVLFSKFQNIFANSSVTSSKSDLFESGNRVQATLALLIIPLLIAGAFFFSGIIIKSLADKFLPYIDLIKIMILGIFPLTLIHIPNQILITQNKFRSYILLSVTGILIMVFSLFLCRFFHKNLQWVAVVTSFSYLVYFTFIYYAAFKPYNNKIKDYFIYLFTMLYTIALVLLIEKFMIFPGLPTIVIPVLELVIFLLLFLPVYYLYEIRNHILLNIISTIKNRIFKK